jgi:signal transduction histidine kinase
MPGKHGKKGAGMGSRRIRIWVPGEAPPKTKKTVEELREDFIGVVSYDLRTPISIIKEGVSLLLDEIPGKITEEQAAVLRSVKESIERLSRTIDNLLDQPGGSGRGMEDGGGDA